MAKNTFSRVSEQAVKGNPTYRSMTEDVKTACTYSDRLKIGMVYCSFWQNDLLDDINTKVTSDTSFVINASSLLDIEIKGMWVKQ